MNTSKHFYTIVFALAFILSIYFGVFRVQANSSMSISVADEQQIKQVINNYFEARYQSFKTLQLSDFAALLISNNDNQKEIEKLDLNIYQHKVNQLKYQQYTYYLDFGEMSFDSTSALVNIKVTEGSDVLYVNMSPEMTKMRGLEHIVILQKVNGNWKIYSDKYEDDFWKMMRSSNSTNIQLRSQIDNVVKQYSLIKPNLLNSASNKATLLNAQNCTIDGVNVCFNRQEARNYADTYYYNPNPNYLYASLDCTNFVSQALYEGGNISMFKPSEGMGMLSTAGWFYTDRFDYGRSTSWAGVEPFHAFFVPKPEEKHFYYLGGPIARELNQSDSNDMKNLQIGDIIQFDWSCTDENGCEYDHSVIVVDIWGYNIYVDAHSLPYEHKVLTAYAPWNAIRYIHINDHLQQRPAYLPSLSKNVFSAPIVGSPYPAPGKSVSSNSSSMPAYPAPISNDVVKPDQGYPAP